MSDEKKPKKPKRVKEITININLTIRHSLPMGFGRRFPGFRFDPFGGGPRRPNPGPKPDPDDPSYDDTDPFENAEFVFGIADSQHAYDEEE